MLGLLRASDDFELKDSYRVLHPKAKGVGTFNSWSGETGGEKIDAVLVGPGIDTLEAEILRENENGRYPSDHYPVRALVATAATP